jgi:histone H3/H4
MRLAYKESDTVRGFVSDIMQHDQVLEKKQGPKQRRKKGTRLYDAYIHRIMKRTKPGFGLTHSGVAVMNKFITQVESDLSSRAAELARQNGTKTLGAREVETAVVLTCQEELATQAIVEGRKAVEMIRRQ